jgi:hypothetical protein
MPLMRTLNGLTPRFFSRPPRFPVLEVVGGEEGEEACRTMVLV